MMDSSNANEAFELSRDTALHDDAPPLTAQILPYAFAKRHGVLIGQIEDDSVNLLYRDKPNPIILAEVRRITRRNLSLSSTTEEQFSALLAQTYEQGSDQALAMMEGVGDELNLDELASTLEPEDLM